MLNVKGQKPTKFQFLTVAHEPVGIKTLLIAHFLRNQKFILTGKAIVHNLRIFYSSNITVIV